MTRWSSMSLDLASLNSSLSANHFHLHVFYCSAMAQLDRLARQIGQRIRALRERRGLTMEKLAYESDGLGSKGYLSDIENGKRLPSIKALAGLADRLGVEPYELLVAEPLSSPYVRDGSNDV
jgi:ribosome-binding protein aMBF1 (putative translation factor)